jgi:hypothetical protein
MATPTKKQLTFVDGGLSEELFRMGNFVASFPLL